MGRGAPVTMDETAAQVQTTTVLPSLSPQVCSMRPAVVSPEPARMPAGMYRMLTWLPSRNPVRQAAADSPKQAPACHQPSKHQIWPLLSDDWTNVEALVTAVALHNAAGGMVKTSKQM